MSDELRFDGQVVIVTGAGNGLGRCHALMFGARGAKVVVNDLGGDIHGDGNKSSNAADKVVEEIKAAGGEAVANYDSVEDGEAIVKTALDAFGTVDVVVNNAGILRDVSFAKMTHQDWDLVQSVHLNGSFKVTHAAWPIMREKGYGRIIMTTSAAGIYGNFGQANYSSAKLGLVGLANTLAIEGRNKGIHVNTIAPIAASRLTETVLPAELLAQLKPEYVTPLVGWLSHADCEEAGGLFEVGAGTINKLRWERTIGHGFRLDASMQPEDIAAKWSKICDFKKTEHPADIAGAMSGALDNINNPKRGGNEFIDLDVAAEEPAVEVETSYDERDLSLYALGVGAGADPLDPSELSLVHERGSEFYTLPTYGVMPALNGFMKLMQEGVQPPGMNVGFDRVLHGEQYTEIKRPLPPHATLTHKAKLRDAYDKGKHAIGIVDVHSYDEDGDEVAYNEISFFLRGAGGWGGDRGPSADINVPPSREPDAVIEEKISDSQALLYRLSGDWNPLHVDPEFAKNFGFDRPILHGLCTFGYVGRHVIKAFCDNDPRRFKSIKVRFAETVYPGETLETRMWQESDLRIVFETRVVERDKVVIKNAAIELYEQIPAAKSKAKAVEATAEAAQSEQLIAADVFTAIGAYIAGHPDLVAQAKTLFQFNLSEPDSNWVIDLKEGEGGVSEGEAGKADATLSVSEENFLAMCTGEADAQKLFFAGKLKIDGDMMAAAKLEFLKEMDPAKVEVARQTRVASGGGQTNDANQAGEAGEPGGRAVIGMLSSYLAEHPELVGNVGKVYQWNVSDPDVNFVLDLKNGEGSVYEGSAEHDTSIDVDEENLMAMMRGEADAQKLYFAGKLKIGGDIMASQKLQFLADMDPTEVQKQLAAASAQTDSGSESSQEPAAKKSSREPVAAIVFDNLKQRLTAGNDAINGLAGHVIQFDISDPDKSWTLDCSGDTPKLVEGASHDAQAVLGLADKDLEALAKGDTDVQDMHQRGLLRVDGDITLAREIGFMKGLV